MAFNQNCLDGKTAIVTGGCSGIGLAIARKFLSHGSNIVIFDRNLEASKPVCEQLRSEFDRKISFYQVDVSSFDDVGKTCESVLNEHSQVEILVNNAGITRDNLLLRMKEEDWDAVLNVNLKSVYNTCQALTRSMMRIKGAKIINIASVVALMGNPGQSNYAASKAGLIGFSKSLAKELASRGVCVNCIAPGYIETKMTDILSDQQKDQILAQIPMKRMGQVDEVAQTALFLASPSSDFITGQVISVDGGMVMR